MIYPSFGESVSDCGHSTGGLNQGTKVCKAKIVGNTDYPPQSSKRITNLGWALWLMPVIPTLGRPRQVGHEVKRWRPPGQHGLY